MHVTVDHTSERTTEVQILPSAQRKEIMEGKLINMLMNTHLLLTNFSKEEWLTWTKEHKGENIFFGVGLMTHTTFSEAIPFDILGMFFIAENLRRLIKGKKVFILVADQHAITNQLIPEKKIQEKTKEILQIFKTIIKSFHLDNFEIIQTTSLNSDERIKKIYRQELPDISNDYLKHEIADAIWLSRFHKVGIKLGWAMNIEQFAKGHDERFFDTEIAKFCKSISFIHATTGKTANQQRPRVSPYISIFGEERLLLKTHEDVARKTHDWKIQKDNSAVKPMLKHLSQIVRLHDQLFNNKSALSLENKMQQIISKIAKN